MLRGDARSCIGIFKKTLLTFDGGRSRLQRSRSGTHYGSSRSMYNVRRTARFANELRVGQLVDDVDEDFLGGAVTRLLPRCDFNLDLRIGL